MCPRSLTRIIVSRTTFLAGAAICLVLCAPAQARIIGERAVSDPVYSNAPGGKYPPIIATDGDGFLVAWNDDRSLDRDLYAARVTAGGAVLDPIGILVAQGTGNPKIVFAGDTYSIFWMEFQPGANGDSLFIARVSRDGRIVDGPRVIADGFPFTAFDASTNGRRIVLAWTDRVAVLSAEGELLERGISLQNCLTNGCPPGVLCPPAPACSSFGVPRIASNGSGFVLAVPSPPQNVSVFVLDGDGHPTFRGIADMGALPAGIASDGNDYVLLDVDAKTNNAVAQRISAAGDLLERHDLGVALGVTAFADVGLIWTGASYAGLSRTNFGDAPKPTLLLTRSGEPLSRPPAGDAELASGAIASNGRDIVAAWNGGTSTQASIFTERVDPATLSNGDPLLVSISAKTQRSPSIAFSGIGYAVAWYEGSRAWLRRFSLNGDPLDALPIPLEDGVVGDSFAPRVAFDGRNYVAVALTDHFTPFLKRYLRLTRIDAVTGQTMGSFEILALASQQDNTFDLRSNGTNTVLAWEGSDFTLHAGLVTDNGLANDITLTSMYIEAVSPSLAWNGSEWLVAYHTVKTCCPFIPEVIYDYHVYGIRLSPSLTVLDPNPVELSQTDRDAHAASAGGDFMVAMTHLQPDPQSGKSRPTVLLRRLHADGTLGGDAQMIGDGKAMDIAADGSRYAVAIAKPASSSARFQQFVEYVDQTGAVSGSERVLGITLWGQPAAQLVAGDAGIVAAYQRTAYEPVYGGVDRVFLGTGTTLGRSRASSHVIP